MEFKFDSDDENEGPGLLESPVLLLLCGGRLLVLEFRFDSEEENDGPGSDESPSLWLLVVLNQQSRPHG